MKTFYYCFLTVVICAAGCSKSEPNGGTGTASPPSAPAKPKVTELTQDVLLDAFKRSSINFLPVFLKVNGVQFEVVNSVDTTRVIKGTVTLEVLEDTFRPSRMLQYQTPSTLYQIQLLSPAKKKGETISLPFSTQFNLAESQPTVVFPNLDDYGSEVAKFSHACVEGSEQATKAETLINDAKTASKKADLLQNKWQNLTRLKEGITDLDTFRGFLNGGGWSTIIPAFDDSHYYDSLFATVAVKLNANLPAQYEAFTNSVVPKLDPEYSRVEKIISEAKAKSQTCTDYLMNL